MSEQPVFTGTPDDWWEAAERITVSEADERNLGDWYIVRIVTRRSGGEEGTVRYNVSTPSKPPKPNGKRWNWNNESAGVRCLIRGRVAVPEWMTAELVLADDPEFEGVRQAWVRKKSGRWTLLQDNRVAINDHTMSTRNPKPAAVTEDLI